MQDDNNDAHLMGSLKGHHKVTMRVELLVWGLGVVWFGFGCLLFVDLFVLLRVYPLLGISLCSFSPRLPFFKNKLAQGSGSDGGLLEQNRDPVISGCWGWVHLLPSGQQATAL